MNLYGDFPLVVKPHAVAVGTFHQEGVVARSEMVEMGRVGRSDIGPVGVVGQLVGILDIGVVAVVQGGEADGEIALAPLHVNLFRV